ncbi:MAG: permease [Desulfobacterales bacterium]|nr:MAG: permease [Desulfobacterales bacterium]
MKAIPPHLYDSTGGHLDHSRQKSGRSALFAQSLFVLLCLSLLVFFRERAQFHTLGIIFVSIVLEALPFVLLGTLIGGFIEVFVPSAKITRWLPERRWWTVFIGAGVGLIFPVCECAIVPVVRRLLQKGVPLGSAVAFLLGGPIVNPLVAASTAVAYFADWSVVIRRMVFGYLVAVAVGFLINLMFTKARAIRSEVFSDRDHLDHTMISDHGKPSSLGDKVGRAVSHAAEDFFDIGRFLIVGAFIAAVLQTLIPRQLFAAMLDTPALSILIMMTMAAVLNLCSEADAFVAASFRSSLVPLSAQLAFMILGPMLDIKLIIMYLKIFRASAIVTLAVLTFAAVFVVTILT